MAVLFRPITVDDIPYAAALWHDGWQDGHRAIVPAALTRLRTLDSFAERLAQRVASTRVAETDGRITGFFTLDGDELYQFYVAPSARGSGLAQDLMTEAESALRSNGVAIAWLACTVGNARAARFYEKSGWSRARTEALPVETSDGPFTLDIWRYEKRLGT